MRRRKIPPLGKDEITLFDFACKELPQRLGEDARKQVSLVLTVLLACAEGHTLDMNKVAQLGNVMREGQIAL